MKIHKHGEVIIPSSGAIRVEGFNIEREPDDPAGATDEQLLLAYAVHMAQKKLNAAILSDYIRKALQSARKDN